MAVMERDHGAGSFRSMSPPARIDSGEHDTGMLNTPGHHVTMPPVPSPGYELGVNPIHTIFKPMLDQDTDRGF